MSLVLASSLDELPLPTLTGSAPWPCAELSLYKGRRFLLPASDPVLVELFHGGPAPRPALEGLVGATTAWRDDPEWMDFLDPKSPAHVQKLRERELYLARWAPYLARGGRVLDLGAGIGRFSTLALDAGAELLAVDADLRSLWRLLWHAAGREGSLDLRWSLAERLGSLRLGTFDLVIAAELLSYCERPRQVLGAVLKSLRPGGHLLLSVEARYGWAAAPDVAEGSLGALFSQRSLHVRGDRFVRTWSEPELRALLADFEILELIPSHYTLGGPFTYAAGSASLEQLLRWEARCRADPVLASLNRAWSVVARRETTAL